MEQQKVMQLPHPRNNRTWTEEHWSSLGLQDPQFPVLPVVLNINIVVGIFVTL